MKMRKILLTALSAMLIVCLSVGATVAYLTSSDTVTNTFTVGSVKITLDEGKVNENGICPDPNKDRVTSNDYHLFPGQEYDKDPTIHIQSEEDAWLRVVVTVENADALNELFKKYPELKPEDILNGLKDENGEGNGLTNFNRESFTKANNVYTYIYDYNTKVNNTTGANGHIMLFNKVCVPYYFDNDDMEALNGANMTITAYAVQADGFDSCEAAMAAGFSDVFGTAD